MHFDVEYWEQSDEDDFKEYSSGSSQFTSSQPEDREVTALTWWIVAFISLFQSLHVIPDWAIGWLTKFISALLSYCGQFSSNLKSAINALLHSLHLCNKHVFNFDATSFKIFVVCPSCHCLYDFTDLFERRGTRTVVKTCPSRQARVQCNSDLFRKVYTSSGNLKLYPFKCILL